MELRPGQYVREEVQGTHFEQKLLLCVAVVGEEAVLLTDFEAMKSIRVPTSVLTVVPPASLWYEPNNNQWMFDDNMPLNKQGPGWEKWPKIGSGPLY